MILVNVCVCFAHKYIYTLCTEGGADMLGEGLVKERKSRSGRLGVERLRDPEPRLPRT